MLTAQRTAGNRGVVQLLAARSIVAPPTAAPVRLQRTPLHDLLDAASSAISEAAATGVFWLDVATRGPVLATVTREIKDGNHDVDKLTNTAFFMLHPELGGRKLDPAGTPGDDALAKEWATIRSDVVKPALRDYRAQQRGGTEPGTATGGDVVAPDGPAPSLGTDVGTNAAAFFTEHEAEISALPGSTDELKLLLTLIVDKGATDADYPNWLKPTARWRQPGPLTQAVFGSRHPDKQPLTNIPIWKYGKLKDQWAANNLTDADWVTLNDIKETLVYPLLRYTLPKITAAPTPGAGAGTGVRIAAAAYAYLGVKYELGGEWSRKEETGSLDCSGLVNQVFKDAGATIARGASGNGVARLHDSDLTIVTEPQAGDLLLRQKDGTWKHVGIYVGEGKLIEAPATGSVVRVSSYDASKWDEILRHGE
ncbi:C40 family peptidase [Georgenia satyanarayanai]|uniref:C40 family peptidase n=1 Tax=Georgenia satyanarayanai TaxID=860221 RepID=UPI00203E5CDD|nr:NlpC/P60 family protein [Georgenia satyanarayanai]MCM3659402.1 C40 family peptidase [Georgenia satyanarayanai]